MVYYNEYYIPLMIAGINLFFLIIYQPKSLNINTNDKNSS